MLAEKITFPTERNFSMRRFSCIVFLHLMVFFSLINITKASSKSHYSYHYDGSSIFVSFMAPKLDFIKTRKGTHRVELPDRSYLMDPGNPNLPEIIKLIPVPASRSLEVISIQIVRTKCEELKGFYEIEPSPPLLLSTDRGNILDWGKSKKIKHGKNILVYSSSRPFPVKPVKILATKTKRNSKFLRLAYYPVRYYPGNGKIEVVKEIQCKITLGASETSDLEYQSTTVGETPQNESDSGTNPAPADIAPGGDTSYDYVIITSNAVVNNSTKLSDFVRFKEAIGHSVLVVTEDDYTSLSGPPPDGRAEKIRQWLINNYQNLGIKYVLLIGNPDPSNGDVPMKKCYPRSHESSHREALTDYYYADLTGNWDIDGDELYGEYPDDNKPGGVDYAAEVWVGRVPVYDDYSTLDHILQKIMDYQTESGDLSWRKEVLLPTAILNFEQEPPDYLTRTDGAELAQKIINDFLESNDFTHFSLYEKQGLQHSTYPSDAPLNRTNVKDSWASGYGLVCAVGHGNATSIYRKYWSSDDNQNDTPESGETTTTSFFTSSDSRVLDDSHPSMVYLCACSNGYPENSDNLGYSLLKQGAIATVSASRVSWYTAGWTEPNPNYPDNFSLGYYYLKKLAQDIPCGQALALTKEEMIYNSPSIWLNLQGFNLYGDPEISLVTIHSICTSDMDGDGDVDGVDLAILAEKNPELDLSEFSEHFGKSSCIE
ncbi:MAG: hypothetical protein DRG83_05245 [Deltaproteobacteria bacterium]|nr:MAG: hypothetical protein DRG83_05245 [Deltaproteobacteria bacterium]